MHSWEGELSPLPPTSSLEPVQPRQPSCVPRLARTRPSSPLAPPQYPTQPRGSLELSGPFSPWFPSPLWPPVMCPHTWSLEAAAGWSWAKALLPTTLPSGTPNHPGLARTCRLRAALFPALYSLFVLFSSQHLAQVIILELNTWRTGCVCVWGG